jgi:hypothetical protein
MNALKRLEDADRMIGQLSSGKYYFLTISGIYRESRSKAELVQYLIDNKLV